MTNKNMFAYFTEKTGIIIPEDIVDFYSSEYNKNKAFDFIRLFKSQIKSVKEGHPLHIKVLISEEFALQILNVITTLNLGEEEEFVAQDNIFFDTIDAYNIRENKFKTPVVQQAYEQLGSNPEIMKVVLVMWMHCGGEGGLILKGKNSGYETEHPHNDSDEIEYNSKIIDYRGYKFEEYEKPQITASIEELKRELVKTASENIVIEKKDKRSFWSKLKGIWQ